MYIRFLISISYRKFNESMNKNVNHILSQWKSIRTKSWERTQSEQTNEQTKKKKYP